MGAGIGASNMRCMFNELGAELSLYLNFCLNQVQSQSAAPSVRFISICFITLTFRASFSTSLSIHRCQRMQFL